MSEIQIFLIRRDDGIYCETQGMVPTKHLQSLSNFVSQLVGYLSRTSGAWSQISCVVDSEEVNAEAARKLTAQDARVKADARSTGQESCGSGPLSGNLERYRFDDDKYCQEAGPSVAVQLGAGSNVGQGEVQPRNDCPLNRPLRHT